MVVRRWPAILAALVFVTSVAIAVAEILRHHGELIYALDDAYIHMAMAKNFAVSHVWGCTRYNFVSASSSPLWTCLVAATYFVVGVRDVVPLFLNVLCGIATLVVADAYLAASGVPVLLRTVGGLSLIIVGNFTSLTLMGMEHLLHLGLTVWFAAASARALRASAVGRDAVARLCVLAGLLAMSRYEGAFLVALVAGSFVLRGRVVIAVLIGVAGLLPICLYGLAAVANGGWFLPNSLMLKAGGSGASPFGALLKPFGAADAAFYRNNPPLFWLAIASTAVALINARRIRTSWDPRVLLPTWLTLMIVLHGHFVFSPTYWAYRYDTYLLALGAVVVTLAIAGSSAQRTDTLRLAQAVALAVLVVATADVRGALGARAEIAGAANTFLEHHAMARFIRAFYPRDIVVLNDVGAVTYYTDARVLDAVGLCSNEPVRIARKPDGYTSSDVQAWTAAAHASVAIIQVDWAWIAPRIPAQWTKVAEVRVPTHGQRVGFFAIDPAAAPLLRANVQYFYGVQAASAAYAVREY